MPNERQLFWFNLDHIKDKLNLSDEAFAKYIGVSFGQYKKCRENLAFLPTAVVYELAEKCNFHFADLLTPNFELNFTGGEQFEKPLPDRYTTAAYSKLAPTKNIINYLEKTRGRRAKLNLIRKFQLSEEYLGDVSNRANIHLISDVVKYLAETYQFTEKEFIAMGQQTPFTIDILKDKLSDHKDIYGVLDAFFAECTQIFDKNCDYRITDIVNDFAIIEGSPRKEVLDELKVRPEEFGNEEVCLTKMGCISSMTYFKYRRYGRMEKLTSIYAGDASNTYLLDLAPFKKLSGPFPAGNVLDFKPINH